MTLKKLKAKCSPSPVYIVYTWGDNFVFAYLLQSLWLEFLQWLALDQNLMLISMQKKLYIVLIQERQQTEGEEATSI